MSVIQQILAGLKPASSGSLLPTDVAGLQFWYKADSFTTLVDGDQVNVGWNDGSGTGNHAFTQRPENPIFKTNILNGLPALRFDGSVGGFNLNTPLTGTTFSLFALYKETATRFNVLGGGAGGQTFFGSGYSIDDIFLRDESDAGLSLSDTNPNSFVVLSTVNNAGSAQMWRDGVSKGTGTVSGTISFATIGTRNGNLERSTGDLIEVFGFNAAVSSGDRIALQNYLGARGGLF